MYGKDVRVYAEDLSRQGVNGEVKLVYSINVSKYDEEYLCKVFINGCLLMIYECMFMMYVCVVRMYYYTTILYDCMVRICLQQ